MAPFFSIVIPVYNRASFIREVLLSVSAQSFSNFEIIVIDDGSTDNTKREVESVMSSDARVKYCFQKNSERGAARNSGIKMAQGQYIVFLDSDDVLLVDYLSNLEGLIVANPTTNFLAPKFLIKQDEALNSTDVMLLQPGIQSVSTVLKGNPFACNICIKKSNPDLIMFNEDRTLSTMEDWIFLVQNLFKSHMILGSFTGVHMQQHEGRSMQQNQLLIERRLLATEFLDQAVPFTTEQKSILWGYSYYFCAVHSYIDKNKTQALQYVKKGIEKVGYTKKFFLLWIKIILGKSVINFIKAHV